MNRIACAWIPHFELAAHRIKDPVLATRAVILADVSKPQAKVIDANDRASIQGALPGLALSSARALCPEATLVAPDPSLYETEGERVLAALYAIAPIVGRDRRGAFFLSLQGLEKLEPDESRLAGRVLRAVARLGYAANVAVADGLQAAWTAAQSLEALTTGLLPRPAKKKLPPPQDAHPRKTRPQLRPPFDEETRLFNEESSPPIRTGSPGRNQGSPAILVIPPGEDARAIARLPAPALPMPEKLAELCLLLGVETVGELQQLPKGSLTRRFGRDGSRVERMARAEGAATFRAETPSTIDEAALDLDLPVSDLEPLLFLMKSVLDRLVISVAQGRRALAQLEIVFTLDDRSVLRHQLRPATPTLLSRPIVDLLRLWLSEKPLPTAVRAIVLRATEVADAEAKQLRLFERRADQAGEAMEQAIARLVAAFGKDAVVSPRLADTWRPEKRLLWGPPASGDSPAASVPSRNKVEPRATASGERGKTEADHRLLPVLRFLAEPETIELDSRAMRRPHRRSQPLSSLEGPYRVQGEWWESSFERDYFIASTRDGEKYWLFREAGQTRLAAWMD